MQKFYAVLRLIAALLLAIMAIATAVNLIFISMRPETISVVNTMIGQGILVACMSALATVLFRTGLKQLRAASEPSANQDPE